MNFLTIKIGSHIAPEGTFHHLKLGILLSLAVSKVEIKRFGGSLSCLYIKLVYDTSFYQKVDDKCNGYVTQIKALFV